jgi:hypothetical protein
MQMHMHARALGRINKPREKMGIALRVELNIMRILSGTSHIYS